MVFIPAMAYEFAKMRQAEITREAQAPMPNVKATIKSQDRFAEQSSPADRTFIFRRMCSAIGDLLISAGSSLKRYSGATPTVSELGAN